MPRELIAVDRSGKYYQCELSFQRYFEPMEGSSGIEELISVGSIVSGKVMSALLKKKIVPSRCQILERPEILISDAEH